jgi:diguanylate cyclase (GGDEF)-like protein
MSVAENQHVPPDVPSLPFTLDEAEQVVRKLAPALQDHSQWVQRIHTILICRSLPSSAELAGDSHRATEMGRWFAEEGSEFLRRRPEHAAASLHHQELHARARALCEAVQREAAISPDAYAAFTEAIARFDRSMEALVRELWDLLRHTDPLTGIADRHAMLASLDEARQRLQRTGRTCCICMLDLDHFKEINDRYGHAAGDAALEAISAFLAANLRRYDQVCRYGGEEFVILLPDTDAQSALPIIDRLRRGLAELPIVLGDGTRLAITASFGIATLSAELPVEASIAQADEAMYAAKRAGRNQVRIWQAA